MGSRICVHISDVFARLRARALSLSLCVTACGDRAPVEVEAARTRAPQPQQPYAGALDDSFLAVGRVVPAFAGAYFGEDGALVIRLTDLTDSAKALSELEGLLLNRVRVDPSKVSEARKRELAVPRQWRFEKASHSFAELHQVRSQMFLRAFEDDDVVSLDIDERRAASSSPWLLGVVRARTTGHAAGTPESPCRCARRLQTSRSWRWSL